MPHELIKEKVTLNEGITDDVTQLLLEGDIIVPDIKPDMALILKTDADVYVDHSDITTDRVSFSGKMTVKVLYLAKGQQKTVHSMSCVHKIDDFINIEGVNKDMWLTLSASISNIDYKLLNDRKIGYKALVEIRSRLEGRAQHEFVKTIDGIPERQLKKSTHNVNNIIDNKEDRFIIKDELSLPSGKPNISELLQSSVHISNKDIKLSNGKASVSGDLTVYTLYKSDDEDSVIEFSEHELPFNGVIELPQAKEGQLCDLTLTPEEQYVQVKTNADGEDRMLEVEVSVLANVTVSSQSDIEAMDDAFIVNKSLCLKREKVVYPRLVCKNKNQCPVKEVVELDGDCPDILQIFRVSGKVHIDDKRIIDDKVIVEGVIETDVLYIAKNDNAPLYNYTTALPYRQIIETKGAAPDMDVVIESNIDHVGYNMLSDREMELRFLISFNTRVINRVTAELVTDAEISDMDKSVIENMPSIIIYVAQKGDALWDIAKRYNVSLDELAEINGIDAGAAVAAGQKLLILKKV